MTEIGNEPQKRQIDEQGDIGSAKLKTTGRNKRIDEEKETSPPTLDIIKKTKQNTKELQEKAINAPLKEGGRRKKKPDTLTDPSYKDLSMGEVETNTQKAYDMCVLDKTSNEYTKVMI